MKHKTSAFHFDELILTRWDLVKLFFGKRLTGNGLYVFVRWL
jgi:hypothetical protein